MSLNIPFFFEVIPNAKKELEVNEVYCDENRIPMLRKCWRLMKCTVTRTRASVEADAVDYF